MYTLVFLLRARHMSALDNWSVIFGNGRLCVGDLTDERAGRVKRYSFLVKKSVVSLIAPNIEVTYYDRISLLIYEFQICAYYKYTFRKF